MLGVLLLPVSNAGTLFVSMLSVMTLKMLIDSIMGITTKQNCNMLVVRAWKS